MSGIGTIIDNKYKLTKLINNGGMSAVYLAVNTRLGNRWAIKEIRKTGGNNAYYINSLIAEANFMKDFDHPAFPRIVDIVDTDECLYLVMDYIEGQPLSQVLSDYGPQDEKTVAGWAIELCGALSYLHDQQPPIIYRDMKPSNVILKPDGSLKIIDFGTARVFNPEKANDTVALGTRGFAPPEQYSGQTDARSDIYALGMTMKCLITGVNPLADYSEGSDYSANMSDAMRAIIGKCTEFDPSKRYQSCKELSASLTKIFKTNNPSGGSLFLRILIPVAAVITAAAVTLGIVLVMNVKPKQPEALLETTVSSSVAPTVAKVKSDSSIVPDTVGMEYEKALSAMLAAGFKVKSEEVFSDTVKYGHVVKQSVNGGEPLKKASVVTLTVSKGKESDKDKDDKSSESQESKESSNNNDSAGYDQPSDGGSAGGSGSGGSSSGGNSSGGNSSGGNNSGGNSSGGEDSGADPGGGGESSGGEPDADPGGGDPGGGFELSDNGYDLPYIPD